MDKIRCYVYTVVMNIVNIRGFINKFEIPILVAMYVVTVVLVLCDYVGKRRGEGHGFNYHMTILFFLNMGVWLAIVSGNQVNTANVVGCISTAVALVLVIVGYVNK